MKTKTVSIPPIAAAVLARATVEGNIIRLPEGQLERDAYTAVDKVLKAMGGKWDRRAGGHVFAAGIGEQLADVLSAGKVVDTKKTLEQFYTPAALVKRMCDAAGIRVGTRVLEPSAGNGAIVRQLRACGAHVLAIEIDPRNVMFLIEQDQQVDRRGAGSLFVEQGDFLTMPLKEMGWHHMPDAVVMNPPFSRNQDIEHVMRAFETLAPGGTLVAVMSTHWTFADDAPSRAFRTFVGYPDMRGVSHPSEVINLPAHQSVFTSSVELLPANSFRGSGTNVATVLVTLKKA